MVKDYDLTDVVMCKLQLEHKPQDNDGNVSHCPCCRHYANESNKRRRKQFLRDQPRLRRINTGSSYRGNDSLFRGYIPFSGQLT